VGLDATWRGLHWYNLAVATFLVVRRRSGPAWDPARPMEEQTDWDAHAAYMDDLADKGLFVLAGPLADEVRVAFAVEAESEEAVRETLAADPWHETHLLIDSIEPWTIRIDGRRDEHRVFRIGGISYLRIPAEDPRRSADFYEAVFGWNVRGDPDSPSFDDGTGHVIGHFMSDLPVAGDAGMRPYIYVERVDDALDKVVANGGEVVTPPYPEGDLWVATFRDPAGNQVGVWQRGPR
jgi:predicted enzyme related to lactoylglutathione lyase/uncharacterized protein YciI